MKDESWCKAHMISMLSYLKDQNKFLDMMEQSAEPYRSAAEYLENHPLASYGIVVIGTKAELEKINQRADVYGVYAE